MVRIGVFLFGGVEMSDAGASGCLPLDRRRGPGDSYPRVRDQMTRFSRDVVPLLGGGLPGGERSA